MTNYYKSLAVMVLSLSASSYYTSTNAFLNTPSFGINNYQTKLHSTIDGTETDKRTGKKTGNAFLSEETKERAASGNPIEKAKQAKCATSAFVDVYEYAAKIRAGELTWEEVEKADLDTVSFNFFLFSSMLHSSIILFFINHNSISTLVWILIFVEAQICWNVAQK